MKYLETCDIGAFVIESGTLRVSDPCYDIDTWCAGDLENVKNGMWDALVVKSDEGDWGVRCAELIIVHEDFKMPVDFDIDWEAADIEVGVDSGQAGFFDKKFYKDDSVIEESHYGSYEFDCDGAFYSACGSHTLSPLGAGVIRNGAVSSSGYGDGGYKCEYFMEDDEIVAARIIFISDQEDDYDDFD